MHILSQIQWPDLQTLLHWGGLILLIVIVYLETGFFVGLVVPGGDYMLFTAGLLTGTEYFDFPLWLILLSVTAAAILGDFTGFAQGRFLRERLFIKKDSRFFKAEYLEKTQAFYIRYGLWAFILGRFMPVVRTMIPILAGAAGLPIHRFSFFNIAGAVVWVGTLIPAGYYIGHKFSNILDYSFYILISFVLIASSPLIYTVLKSWYQKRKNSLNTHQDSSSTLKK